jgi:hypothetical protein
MPTADLQPEVEATLKRAIRALDEAGVPFMLGGGLAAWAHGGPAGTYDVDLMVRGEDAKAALEALVAAGMEAEDPPEQWLLKAHDGNVLVDLIYEPSGLAINDDVFGRSQQLTVCAMRTRVMALEDVFSTKLLSMNDNSLDYGPLIKMARAVREQVDWDEVRARTRESPYARGFFALAAELDLVELSGQRRRPAATVRAI